MSQANPEFNQPDSSNEAVRERTPIDHVLERLRPLDLPAKEHFENYLRHKWRANHKPKTLEGSFTSIMLFLQFYGASGKSDITQLQRSDLEAFIEREQSRGMYVTTVKTRMASIIAFLHFLMEQDILSPSVLKKTIRLKLPDKLPRAMNPKDVKRLIEVIDDARDRALILLLLGTGMRYFQHVKRSARRKQRGIRSQNQETLRPKGRGIQPIEIQGRIGTEGYGVAAVLKAAPGTEHSEPFCLVNNFCGHFVVINRLRWSSGL
jgi:hypothetical protein